MTQPQQLPIDFAEQAERRRGRRVHQPDTAEVVIEQPHSVMAVQAVLVNASHDGLCIRHWRKDLRIGQILRVSSSTFRDVAARVMWNWSVGPVVISGLQKIDGQRGENKVVPFTADATPKASGSHSAARAGFMAKVRFALFVSALVFGGWYFRDAILDLWSLL